MRNAKGKSKRESSSMRMARRQYLVPASKRFWSSLLSPLGLDTPPLQLGVSKVTTRVSTLLPKSRTCEEPKNFFNIRQKFGVTLKDIEVCAVSAKNSIHTEEIL